MSDDAATLTSGPLRRRSEPVIFKNKGEKGPVLAPVAQNTVFRATRGKRKKAIKHGLLKTRTSSQKRSWTGCSPPRGNTLCARPCHFPRFVLQGAPGFRS